MPRIPGGPNDPAPEFDPFLGGDPSIPNQGQLFDPQNPEFAWNRPTAETIRDPINELVKKMDFNTGSKDRLSIFDDSLIGLADHIKLATGSIDSLASTVESLTKSLSAGEAPPQVSPVPIAGTAGAALAGAALGSQKEEPGHIMKAPNSLLGSFGALTRAFISPHERVGELIKLVGGLPLPLVTGIYGALRFLNNSLGINLIEPLNTGREIRQLGMLTGEGAGAGFAARAQAFTLGRNPINMITNPFNLVSQRMALEIVTAIRSEGFRGSMAEALGESVKSTVNTLGIDWQTALEGATVAVREGGLSLKDFNFQMGLLRDVAKSTSTAVSVVAANLVQYQKFAIEQGGPSAAIPAAQLVQSLQTAFTGTLPTFKEKGGTANFLQGFLPYAARQLGLPQFLSASTQVQQQVPAVLQRTLEQLRVQQKGMGFSDEQFALWLQNSPLGQMIFPGLKVSDIMQMLNPNSAFSKAQMKAAGIKGGPTTVVQAINLEKAREAISKAREAQSTTDKKWTERWRQIIIGGRIGLLTPAEKAKVYAPVESFDMFGHKIMTTPSQTLVKDREEALRKAAGQKAYLEVLTREAKAMGLTPAQVEKAVAPVAKVVGDRTGTSASKTQTESILKAEVKVRFTGPAAKFFEQINLPYQNFLQGKGAGQNIPRNP